MVGDHRATVAERPEVLRGVEAETPQRTRASGSAPVPARAVRLGGVFDQPEPALAGELLEPVEVDATPVQVDGHDRAGPRGDRGPDEVWVYGCDRLVHVDEHGYGADRGDC